MPSDKIYHYVPGENPALAGGLTMLVRTGGSQAAGCCWVQSKFRICWRSGDSKWARKVWCELREILRWQVSLQKLMRTDRTPAVAGTPSTGVVGNLPNRETSTQHPPPDWGPIAAEHRAVCFADEEIRQLVSGQPVLLQRPDQEQPVSR